MGATIYMIPGLLTNETIYRGLRSRLDNDTKVLEFIPAEKNETLKDYVKRFSKQIDTTKPFYLLGVSFGGILCIELSKLVKSEGIILISSAKNRNELSLFMKQELAAKTILKHIPSAVIRDIYTKGFNIGSKFVPRFKAIDTPDIRKMINSIDGKFEKWVMQQFPTWNGKLDHPNHIHIHGNKDSVFPYKRIKGAKVIDGGTHSIIIHRDKEIAELINDYIQEKA